MTTNRFPPGYDKTEETPKKDRLRKAIKRDKKKEMGTILDDEGPRIPRMIDR